MRRPPSANDVPNALGAIAFLIALHLAVSIAEAVFRMCRP